MLLTSWLSELSSHHSSRIRRRPRVRRRRWRRRSGAVVSALEQLEDRVLLSALSLDVSTYDDVVDATAAQVAANEFGDDGLLSLREAILAANENAGGTIFLEAGTYNLTIVGQEDSGAAGDLDILTDVTIYGAIEGGTIIDAAAINDRIFHVIAGSETPKVQISFLTIQGGNAARGGGLLNSGGNVELFETTITGNNATTEGPGYVNDDGLLRLTNSELISNTLDGVAQPGPILNVVEDTAWQYRDEVAQAIDKFLVNLSLELEQNFRGALSEIQIPVIGDKLREAFDPILDTFAETRASMSDFLDTVANLPDLPTDIYFPSLVQGALFTALGGGDSALNSFEPDVKSFIDTLGLDVPELDLALIKDGIDSDNIASPTDILVTMGEDANGEFWLEFDFHLGQQFILDVPDFSIGGAISDLLNPESIGVSDTGSTILSGIGLAQSSSGLEFDVHWDARLGFGVSTTAGVYLRSGTTDNGLPFGNEVEELRFQVEAYAASAGEGAEPNRQFENTVTTPNWSSTLSLGVLQGRLSDGSPAPIQITAPSRMPLNLLSGATDKDFNAGAFTLNLPSNAQTIEFQINSDLEGHKEEVISIDLDFDNDGQADIDPGLTSLLLALNAKLALAYETPLPPVSFRLDFSGIEEFFGPEGFTLPYLVLHARSPDIHHLTISKSDDWNGDAVVGPEVLGFLNTQYEDRRAHGMGLGNNSSSTLVGGEQVLVAERAAPTDGVVQTGADFYIQIGGTRTTVDGVTFTETTADSVFIHIDLPNLADQGFESLDDLVDRLNEVLRHNLVAEGLAPNSVYFEIGDEGKLQLVGEDAGKLLTVTYSEIETSRFSFLAAVDITNPGFDPGGVTMDQTTFDRLSPSAIFDAVQAGTLTEIFNPSLLGDLKIRLHATTDPEDLATTNPDSSPFQSTFLSDVAMAMPNVEFDFIADVKLDGGKAIESVRSGEKLKFYDAFEIPTLKIENIQLDIAGLLEHIVVPVAQSIAELLAPVLEVVGTNPDAAAALFNQRIPVISDLLGEDVTLRDILGENADDWITEIAGTISDLANLGQTVTDYLESEDFEDAMGGLDKFNYGGLQFIMDPQDPLYFPRTYIPIPTDLLWLRDAGEAGVGSFMKTFVAVGITAPPGLSIDLFRPGTVLDMLTGQPFDIISFGLPGIDAASSKSFGFDFEAAGHTFSMDIGGAVEFESDLRFVYDSVGLEQIVAASKSGAAIDWSDLLNGLAIENNPGGFELGGSVSFDGYIDPPAITISDPTGVVTDEEVEVFDGYGDLHFNATLGLELKDPNNDGKLRLNEIAKITDGFTDPEDLLCMFDVQGNASTEGEITVEVAGADGLNLSWDESTGEFSLKSLLTSAFGVCVEQQTPVLASVVTRDGKKVLRLNTGAFASDRLYGDVSDSRDHVRRLVLNDDRTVDLFEGDGSVIRFDTPNAEGEQLPLREGELPLDDDGQTIIPVTPDDAGGQILFINGTGENGTGEVVERYAAPDVSGRSFLLGPLGNINPNVFLRQTDGGYQKWIVDTDSPLYLTGAPGSFELRLHSTSVEEDGAATGIFSNTVTTFTSDLTTPENSNDWTIDTVTDWLGATTVYDYDGNGRLQTVTQSDKDGNLILTTPYFHGVEEIHVATEGNVTKVWGYGVSEADAQRFTDIEGVLGYGGIFRDHFDLLGVVGTPVEIIGRAGDDSIIGGSGADRLEGGAGDDRLTGGDSADTIIAGTGANTVSDGSGNDIVDFTQNSVGAIFTTGGGDDIVYGSRFDDTFTATSGNVTFDGRLGNDTLTGAGGNDTFIGGYGADILTGNAGDDTLTGGSGDDDVEGGAGTDLLDGGRDNDRLYGLAGADTLLGRAGNDTLIAGLGDAMADGSTGRDDLEFRVDEFAHEGILDQFGYAVSGGATTPYINIESILVTLGDGSTSTANPDDNYDLTIDGPIVPLQVVGGEGADYVTVKDLPSVANPLIGDDLSTTINLAGGKDTITVLDSGRELFLEGGLPFYGGSETDKLIIDRTADVVPREGELTPDHLSGLGMATVNYVSFEKLTIKLGQGDDRLHVVDTNDTTQTTIQMGLGADEAVVEAVSSVAGTIINGNRDFADSNNDSGEDKITLLVTGDPNALPMDSFGELDKSVDMLRIDNSQNAVANADWSFEEGQIFVGGTFFTDTAGVDGKTIFIGGGADDSLTVQDLVNAPQFVLVNNHLVRIREGQNVLSPASGPTRFENLNYDAQIDGLDGVTDLAVSEDGRFVYAVGNADNAISVYRRRYDTSDGVTLEFVQVLRDGQFGVDGLFLPTSIEISPDGKWVYVGNEGDRTIARFSRVSDTGRLVYRGQTNLNRFVQDFVISPDGQDVYVATVGGLYHFSRDATTGTLSYEDSVNNSTPGTFVDIAIGQDGDVLFTVNGGNLKLWDLGPNGELPGTYSNNRGTTYEAIEVGPDHTLYGVYYGGVDEMIGYSEAGFGSIESHYVANSVNKAPGISIAVDTDDDRVVTSFDEDSVIPSTTIRTLRLKKIEIGDIQDDDIDPFDSHDEIYLEVNGSRITFLREEETVANVTDDSTLDLNHLFSLSSGESYSIKIWEDDGDGKDHDDVLFHLLADSDVPVSPPIDASWPDAIYTQKYTVHGPADSASVYTLVFQISSQTQPTPEIKPLAIFGRFGGGELSYPPEYVDVTGTNYLDELAVNSQNDDIYGGDTRHDRITINNALGQESVIDGHGQNDLRPSHASDEGVVKFALSADGTRGYAVSTKYGMLTAGTMNGTQYHYDNDDSVYGGFVSGSNLATTPTISGQQMVYVTNLDEDSLYVYQWNVSVGALELKQIQTDGLAGVAGLDGASDIVVSPDNEFVYVVGENDGAVAAFAVNGDGTLNFLGTLTNPDIGSGAHLTFAEPHAVAIPSYLYVSSAGTDALVVLEQAGNGTLSLVQTIRRTDPGMDSLHEPATSVVAGDYNEWFYVAASGSDAILVFARDVVNGDLALLQTIREGSEGVHGIDGVDNLAVTDDGQYIIASGDGTAAVFQRDSATGRLVIVQRLNNNSGGFQGLGHITDLDVEGQTLFVATGNAVGAFGGVTGLNIDLSNPEPRTYLVEYSGMETLNVQTGDAGDSVDVANVAVTFDLDTGDGADNIQLRNTAPSTSINSGAGGDIVTLLTTTTGSVTNIHTAAGNDEININATAPAATLEASAGSGDDVYFVDGARVGGSVLIHGDGHPHGDTLVFDAHGFQVSQGQIAGNFDYARINDPAFTGQTNSVYYDTIENVQFLASPLADAGDGYEVSEGGSLALDASATDDLGHTVVSYQWGIGDTFGVVTGQTASLSWSDLRNLGITDDGSYVVWVTVTTALLGNTYQDTAATTLTVNNTAPILDISGGGTVEAGASYRLEFAANDPGDDTIGQWTINWGDGTVETYGGAAPTLLHVYETAGNYTISATAVDEDGGPYGPVTTSLQVLSSRSISGATTGQEGTPYELTLNNPASAAIDEWTVHWGDGHVETIAVSGPLLAATHIYADEGDYQIRVTTRDEDGTIRDDLNPLIIAVSNVAPTINGVTAPTQIDQGVGWTIDVTATDPGIADTLTYEFDFDGDGLFEVESGDGQITHGFQIVGEKTVHVRVRDNDGGLSEVVTQPVSVENVGPIIDGVNVITQYLQEGTPIHFDVVAHDPGGANDLLTYAFDFNNDGLFESSGYSVIGRHVYPDDGSYEVRVLVTDEHGATDEATITVNVENIAPDLLPPQTSLPFVEGQSFSITLHAKDPAGANDELTYEFDFDNDGTYEISGAANTATHTFADDSFPPPGTDGVYQIGLRVTDDDGGTTTTTLEVKVENVRPTIAVSALAEADEGTDFTFHLGDVTDPGADTVTQYIVQWGDGTESVYTSAGDKTHVYENFVGKTVIRVILVDEDGRYLGATHDVVVRGTSLVNGTLFIIGSGEDDCVTIHRRGWSTLRVHANFFPSEHRWSWWPGRGHRDFDLDDIDRVVVYVLGGEDKVVVAGNLDLPFIIDGGSGDDFLHGGQGPSALIGSGGDDWLMGGFDRNLIIGGTGEDSIHGGWGEDLLITGRTSYDNDLNHWRDIDALFSEWRADRPLEERATNIRDGSGTILEATGARLAAGETVFGDCEDDRIIGGWYDWIFADPENDHLWTNGALFDQLQDSPCETDDDPCSDHGDDEDGEDHDDEHRGEWDEEDDRHDRGHRGHGDDDDREHGWFDD